MDLSTILLVVAVVSGFAGGGAARFRSWGTGIGDLFVGTLTSGLIALLATVVLALTHGLDRFGVVHMGYLLAVVAAPIGFLMIALPLHIDQEFATPLMARLLVVAALGLIGFGVWATHVEPRRLVVDAHGLGVTGLDRPLVVGVLADLHADSAGDDERAAIDRLIEAEPDVVVIAGDLTQLEPDEVAERAPEIIGLLRRLVTAVERVIMVEGESDDPEVLAELAEESGVLLLADDIRDLVVAEQRVTFVGLREPLSRDETEAEGIDGLIRDQLANSYGDDDLVLLVSHRPEAVLAIDDLPVDLVISGHTHGGQVALPWVGPLFIPGSIPRSVGAGGLHLVDGEAVYVSHGAGLERGQAPQARFRVRPSVGLLTLVPS